MDVKNLVMGVIALSLGAIMIAGAFLPSVASALIVSGDQIEYENAQDVNAPQHYSRLNSYDVSITVTANDYTVIANGVDIVKQVGGQQPIIMSDSMVCLMSAVASPALVITTIFVDDDRLINTPTGTATNIDISFNGGRWTYTEGDTTYSGTYSWVFGVDPDGEYVTVAGNRAFYANSSTINKDVVYCGYYDTGTLDTGYYTYYDGRLVTTKYDGELTRSVTTVDGTTDIVNVSNTVVTVTDGSTTEEFTPYRCLVKEVAEGHKDSGPMYALMGALPIVVVAGLVMAGIYVFISRK